MGKAININAHDTHYESFAACPFMREAYKHRKCICCESAKINFPDRETMHKFMRKRCMDTEGHRKCLNAQYNYAKYSRKAEV